MSVPPPDTYDVYIGRLDDPTFLWEGGNWNGNVPARIGPLFPVVGYYKPFWEVIKRIEDGTFVGKQTDWGAWVARVSQNDIRKFIKEMVGDLAPESWQGLNAFVENLDAGEEYALVACESPFGNHPVARSPERNAVAQLTHADATATENPISSTALVSKPPQTNVSRGSFRILSGNEIAALTALLLLALLFAKWKQASNAPVAQAPSPTSQTNQMTRCEQIDQQMDALLSKQSAEDDVKDAQQSRTLQAYISKEDMYYAEHHTVSPDLEAARGDLVTNQDVENLKRENSHEKQFLLLLREMKDAGCPSKPQEPR